MGPVPETVRALTNSLAGIARQFEHVMRGLAELAAPVEPLVHDERAALEHAGTRLHHIPTRGRWTAPGERRKSHADLELFGESHDITIEKLRRLIVGTRQSSRRRTVPGRPAQNVRADSVSNPRRGRLDRIPR